MKLKQIFPEIFLQPAANFPESGKPSCSLQRLFREQGKAVTTLRQTFRKAGNLVATGQQTFTTLKRNKITQIRYFY
ncbi:hypothetical protein [Chryseobacterium taeanense]|uniref:hypothetical protein n=1 Tax=Chryseobacterium taeanense TaxID=311334 RepID=UPI0035AE5D07